MSLVEDTHHFVLSTSQLILVGIILALTNFIVVLDITIANVSVPNIAGGLAVSPLEGTYVITSYAVAEAITVPLTGWLALRFGTVRVFILGLLAFGICSALCAMAHSLDFLIVSRVLQGLAGGPLMPLSQTLLLRIFPKDKQAAAIGLWGMTTLLAPIMGPIVGGYICDNYGWPFIFYINLPITLFCGFTAIAMLRPFETRLQKHKIDIVGLVLLVIWVAALQIMLDEGKHFDWFASNFITTLLIVAVIGFVTFIIWELGEEQPIVNIRVFRHKGFTISVITLSLTFGAYFGSVVLTPLWLQSYMGYTATWSGLTVGMVGVLAVLVAPISAKLSMQVDPRRLVFFGVLWMAIWTYIRSFYTTDMTFEDLAFPILIQGIGTPFFFLPLSGLCLASVNADETASAAGLMNFLRTLSGAFATSLFVTSWENDAKTYRAELVNVMNPEDTSIAPAILEHLVDMQSYTLSTNHLFVVCTFLMVFAALIIWIAPKPNRAVDLTQSH